MVKKKAAKKVIRTDTPCHSGHPMSCGATTRKGGKCQQPQMANGRCRLHGGKALSGVASPTFKTGRYSKYLPAHLLSDFESAKRDPELVECRHELALVDARFGQLSQRLQSKKDADLWALLSSTFSTLATSFDSLSSSVEIEDEEGERHLSETTRALESCRSLIKEVRESESTWREIYGLLEQRRKLVETESKRLKDMQQMITAEQAGVLIAAIAEVVKKNVSDRKQLGAISEGLNNIVVGRFGRAS